MAKPSYYLGLGETVNSLRSKGKGHGVTRLLCLIMMAVGGGAFGAPPFLLRGWDGVRHPREVARTFDEKRISNEAPRHQPAPLAPKALILVRKANVTSAERLREFHRGQGIVSELVTIESIADSGPLLAEGFLPTGYKDTPEIREAVTEGYDYSLARKLAQFLRARRQNAIPPGYVILMGDAHEIPPSYYISVPTEFSRRISPTDLCYVADDGCTKVGAALGRIPFSDLPTIENYLNKVRGFLTSSFATELLLMGGKGFADSKLFYGELAVQRAMEKSSSWAGVEKALLTTGRYHKENVLKAFRGEKRALFQYYVDHGRGNELFAEAEKIASREIESLPASTDGLPIFLSPACAAGAYDVGMTRESLLGLLSAGRNSVGEALLRSPAGAVAFVGAPRLSYGQPTVSFDTHGNLIQGDNSHFLHLLDLMLEQYGGARQTLGELWYFAVSRYVESEGRAIEEPLERWTYSGLTLLGDPTLWLPLKPRGERARVRAESRENFDGMGERWPFWKLVPPFFFLGIFAEAETTLFRVKGEQVGQASFERLASERATEHFNLPALEPGTYFLKIENRRGLPVERQVWFDRQ